MQKYYNKTILYILFAPLLNRGLLYTYKERTKWSA